MEIVYGKESFLDRVYRKSHSQKSRDNAEVALDWFEKFCLSRYQRSTDELVQKIMKNELDVYRVLDDFVTYLDTERVAASSIRPYVSWTRGYLSYRDLDIIPYKFQQRVNLPKKQKKNDAQLTPELVARILNNILPSKLKLLCLLELTTTRRPNELLRLRVRDFDFESKPTMITIPSNLSKNKQEGETFTTSECTQLIKDWIKKQRLRDDDYLFGKTALAKAAVQSMGNAFRKHLKVYDDLTQKTEGLKLNRYKIHIYSFKKFGWTRARRIHGDSYANGLKGDKGVSEYDALTLEEKKEMYLELEPELTILDASAARKALAEEKDLKELVLNLEKRLGENERNTQLQMNNVLKVLSQLPKYGINLQGSDVDKEGIVHLQFSASSAKVQTDGSIDVRIPEDQ